MEFVGAYKIDVSKKNSITLQDGEVILSDEKPTVFVRNFAIFVLVVSVLLGLVFGPWMIALGIAFWLKERVRRERTSRIITNHRLYIAEGIFTRSKREIPMGKINDVQSQQGICQRIFGYGDIIIYTGNDAGVMLREVADPEAFRTTILTATRKS